MTAEEEFSDACLSVYGIVPPRVLVGRWSGERYAVQMTQPDGSRGWEAASEDAASAHGRRYGWDRVAQVVPGWDESR